MAALLCAKTIVIRDDFEGIVQLWPPPDSQTNPKFDIVFVPGLAGGSISTWMHETGQFWLDWLLLEIPDIRIFAFGYKAENVYLKLKHEQIHSHGRTFTDAEDLCNALRDTPARVEKPCPLTIVGHGVGGIIVKNALVLCNALPTTYGQILRDTHHVLFLDTPHLGLDTQTWLAVYGKLATPHAKQQFSLWSLGLAELGNYFGGISMNFSITTVNSTHPMENGNDSITVVQESSSVLNLPNETRMHLSSTTHLTMCKFASQKDANYRKLRDRIAAEIRNRQKLKRNDNPLEANALEVEAQLKSIRGQVGILQADNKTLLVNATKAQTEQERAERRKLKSKILKWLVPSDQAIDYDAELESDRTKAVDNTCAWIFSTDEYEEWMSTTLSKMCWVHGIPGCGKSTLVASTCRSVSGEQEQVLHFFFKPESSFSTAFALSCLAHQAVHSSESVFEALRLQYEKTRTPTVQSLPTATAVFRTVLQAYGDCFIFLDALDNCKDRAKLLKVLTEILVDIPFGIKIFCSSRDEHDILRTLSGKPSILDVPVLKEKIQQDISTFIKITVEQNPDLMEKLEHHPEALKYIVSQLSDGAQGMFLLPKYFIEDLSVMTDLEQMYKFLHDLPRDIQSYYLQIVSKMDSRYWDLARKIFTWTAWARRPLSLAELHQVLCMNHDQYLNLAQDIKRALGCLITLENDLVRLGHDSVRRFIRDSPAFQSSQNYKHLVPNMPEDEIAKACTTFLFEADYERLPSPQYRFFGQRAALFREISPFLEYASYNWVFHWSMAQKPLKLLTSVAWFFESYQFLDWVESTSHFLQSEGVETIIRMLKEFVVKLKLRISRQQKAKDDMIRAWIQLYRLRKISSRLSELSTFLNSWNATIQSFPEEIRVLAPLLGKSFSTHKFQDVLITRHPGRTGSAKLYNLLDGLTLPRLYDRFMLSDLHIFLWQSLMPSVPWNLSYIPLDPARSSTIKLMSLSITTGIPHGREGLDPAEVGSITVTTSLRKDLRVIGIAWARFSDDKTQPLALKSYAWSLAEDPQTATLFPLWWSHLGEDDPCRVDITHTHAFRMSKCALAFTDDLQTMWTAGGTYNIRTGYHRPAPPLFTDREMRALTFARNCSVIAGIRNDQSLEVYNIPSFRRVVSYKGDCTLLGVSPLGRFVIFLEKLESRASTADLLEAPPPSHYAVSLLSRSGSRIVIWTNQELSQGRRGSQSRSPSPDRKPLSMEEFYSNGGLHAFSQNDTVLVLCVPGSPDWQLLGYDLQTADIQKSRWSVEYTSVLLGAGIMSLSFCPIHERRLYLLDSYCVMRSFDVVRSEMTGGSQISTVEGEDLSPVWTVIPQAPDKPVLTVTEDNPDDPFVPGIQVYEWSLQENSHKRTSCAYGMLAKGLRILQSQTLTADISPFARAWKSYEIYSKSRWEQLGSEVQHSIETTVSGIRDGYAELTELDLRRVTTSLKPRITTNVTFDPSATLGFFQSLIYVPLPADEEGQSRWIVTMIMDIRWLETPKWRKTGAWAFTAVVSKEEESMLTIYHPATRTLVYSISLASYDKVANEHWTETSILLCQLSSQNLTRIESDKRANYLVSRHLKPDCGFVTALEFSSCGNYVFGYSNTWPGSIFQLDIRFGLNGRVVRHLYDPFLCGVIDCIGFSVVDDLLYVAGITGSTISLLKIPFDDSHKYQGTTILSCPYEVQRCQKLSLVWPSTPGGRLNIVCYGVNYLRKDGKFVTTPIWPIIFSAPLDDDLPWNTVEERDRELYFPSADTPSETTGVPNQTRPPDDPTVDAEIGAKSANGDGSQKENEQADGVENPDIGKVKEQGRDTVEKKSPKRIAAEDCSPSRSMEHEASKAPATDACTEERRFGNGSNNQTHAAQDSTSIQPGGAAEAFQYVSSMRETISEGRPAPEATPSERETRVRTHSAFKQHASFASLICPCICCATVDSDEGETSDETSRLLAE